MGDYLAIYDGEDLKFAQLQKLDYNFNDQTKTISGTGKYMTIQFITDDDTVEKGFRAYFNRIPIDTKCAEWLNTTALILASPDYPTIDCIRIITASIGSTISIKFQIFEVKKILNFFDTN